MVFLPPQTHLSCVVSVRRAHLKECFETLKKNIPNIEEKKTSNLSVLRSALRYVQVSRWFLIFDPKLQFLITFWSVRVCETTKYHHLFSSGVVCAQFYTSLSNPECRQVVQRSTLSPGCLSSCSAEYAAVFNVGHRPPLDNVRTQFQAENSENYCGCGVR